MQFITILETNRREKESAIHYCQWDGNEAELEKLFNIMTLSYQDDDFRCHEVCTFVFSRQLIPEAAVDAHCKLLYGNYMSMFVKHTGTFKCPPFETTVESEGGEEVRVPMTDPYKCAEALHEYFRNTELSEYFH